MAKESLNEIHRIDNHLEALSPGAHIWVTGLSEDWYQYFLWKAPFIRKQRLPYLLLSQGRFPCELIFMMDSWQSLQESICRWQWPYESLTVRVFSKTWESHWRPPRDPKIHWEWVTIKPLM